MADPIHVFVDMDLSVKGARSQPIDVSRVLGEMTVRHRVVGDTGWGSGQVEMKSAWGVGGDDLVEMGRVFTGDGITRGVGVSDERSIVFEVTTAADRRVRFEVYAASYA